MLENEAIIGRCQGCRGCLGPPSRPNSGLERPFETRMPLFKEPSGKSQVMAGPDDAHGPLEYPVGRTVYSSRRAVRMNQTHRRVD